MLIAVNRLKYQEWKAAGVVAPCNPSTGRLLRQENLEFMASQDYTVRPSLKNNSKNSGRHREKGPSYTAGKKYDDAPAPEKSSVVLQLVKQPSHDSAILLLSTYLKGKKTLYPPKFAHNVHSHYYFEESKI